MNTTARISAIRTETPTQPAATWLSSGLGSEAAASSTMPVMLPVSQVSAGSAISDPREQVVLGDGRLDVTGHELEVLRGPRLRLEIARHVEPGAVRVDLGGVRQ